MRNYSRPNVLHFRVDGRRYQSSMTVMATTISSAAPPSHVDILVDPQSRAYPARRCTSYELPYLEYPRKVGNPHVFRQEECNSRTRDIVHSRQTNVSHSLQN